MKIVVLKFGGSSVGSIERIKNVAKIIVTYIKKRYKVIVVSSAMRGDTNKLVKLSKQISKTSRPQNMILLFRQESRYLVPL